MISKKELEFIKKMSSVITGDIVAMDIGANKGYYSDALINALDRNIEVIYAFEPVPRFFEIANKNLEKYKQVKIYNFACSHEVCKSVFFEIIEQANESAEGLSSINFRDVYKTFNHKEIEVDCIKLDDFIQENGIEKINFVKIDTEGHELSVLKGASESIAAGIFDFLQIEYGDCIRECGHDLDEIIDFLENTPYRIYDFSENKFQEINNSNWEVYKNISWDNFLISKYEL